MKHYEKLLALGCVTRSQLEQVTGSPSAADWLCLEYQRKGCRIAARKSRRSPRSNTICGLGAGIRKFRSMTSTILMRMNLKK